MEDIASKFGQRLVHNDKKYRDQALARLVTFFSRKTLWTDLEWDKLWKALFYCMWMSDKQPIQQELATNLSQLIHQTANAELALSYFQSFLRTMQREWHGIDGLRLDKFYSLVRKMVYEAICLLSQHEWKDTLVERFSSVLQEQVMTKQPNGLRLHICDLYLQELYNASYSTIHSHAFLSLLNPFQQLLSMRTDKIVLKRIIDTVYRPMLQEYQFSETEYQESDVNIKRFAHISLASIQHTLFRAASDPKTPEYNRASLYTLYGSFKKITNIDSLSHVIEKQEDPTSVDECMSADKITVSPCIAKKQKNIEKRKRRKLCKAKVTESAVEEQVTESQHKVQLTKCQNEVQLTVSQNDVQLTESQNDLQVTESQNDVQVTESQNEEHMKLISKKKKVTFGKHRALRHEVSVKRLKAHAKKAMTDKRIAK